MVADNEPNNHLYSLGKFVHTGLHSRHLIVQSCGGGEASGPASNTGTTTMPLPPRHSTVTGGSTLSNVTNRPSASSAVSETAAAASQPDQQVSGSSSEVTSPRPEPVSEAQPPTAGGAVDASTANPQQNHAIAFPFPKTNTVSILKHDCTLVYVLPRATTYVN